MHVHTSPARSGGAAKPGSGSARASRRRPRAARRAAAAAVPGLLWVLVAAAAGLGVAVSPGRAQNFEGNFACSNKAVVVPDASACNAQVTVLNQVLNNCEAGKGVLVCDDIGFLKIPGSEDCDDIIDEINKVPLLCRTTGIFAWRPWHNACEHVCMDGSVRQRLWSLRVQFRGGPSSVVCLCLRLCEWQGGCGPFVATLQLPIFGSARPRLRQRFPRGRQQLSPFPFPFLILPFVVVEGASE